MTDERLIQAGAEIAQRLKELHRGKKFHEFQLAVFNAIFRDGYKRIFIRKGRKGGGTECVMYPVARIIGTRPYRSAYIIGPTQKGQAEIIWDNRRIHRYLPDEWGGVPNEKDKRLRLANESFVKIEGADNPDAARGWEGDIFVWDELKDHNPLSLEACYPNLQARDGIWIVLGTPPTKKSNHYYQLEQDIKNDPDWKFFHWTAWDNPFLPGGHDWLKAEKEKYYRRGEWDLWEIEYEARYVFNSSRKVLPNFDKDKNVESRYNLLPLVMRDARHMKWVAAIDPGYATCFAVLFFCYNPYTGQVFFLDEIYSKERNENSALQMWPLIKAKQDALYKGRWNTIYDSAAASFAVEVNAISRESGESSFLVPTSKKPSDEEEYFRLLNSSFAERGQTWVARECKNFIWEIEEYETNENDDYVDQNNHLLDCARYGYKYIGYTSTLKQGNTIKVSTRPQIETLEDFFRRERQKDSMVGFGGEEAAFSIGTADKDVLW